MLAPLLERVAAVFSELGPSMSEALTCWGGFLRWVLSATVIHEPQWLMRWEVAWEVFVSLCVCCFPSEWK